MHAFCMHTGVMKAIQIRNVPDEVHLVLQERAATAGQSLQEYLLELLRSHASRPTLSEWFDQVEQDRSLGFSDVTTDDVVTSIREFRDE